jgi:transposase
LRRRTRSVSCGCGARETGESHGSVKTVAQQLGFGVESVRAWVKQADIDDGVKPGTTTADAERIKVLEQELKELRRANAILKSASAFFAAELDRPHR